MTQLIQERIDRAFINTEWNVLFPEAIVRHLERIHSDHCPIMLSLAREPIIRLTRPFRFQPMWLSYSDFVGVVSDVWSEAPSLPSAITKFEVREKRIGIRSILVTFCTGRIKFGPDLEVSK